MALGQLTQFDFHHRLAEIPGSVLVFFTAPGCGACRQLKQVLQDSADAFAGVEIFEVDAQQEMALTREFEVFHLPTLFLFSDGEFHAPINAEPRVESLLAAIEAALKAPAMEAP